MTRYDSGMKVAISLPDEALRRIDAAAATLGQNRSEFFRTAGLKYAVEVEANALTHRIDAHLAHLDGDTRDSWATARSRARLAESAESEDW